MKNDPVDVLIIGAGASGAAAALAELGVGPGDRVATLMGKGEDLVVTLLGIWRLGAIHIPLFTAFAPSAIAQRLLPSQPHVVVCDASQRSKLDSEQLRGEDAGWTVVTADDGSGEPVVAPTLEQLIEQQQAGLPAALRDGDDHLVHIYTSGTTGSPKAVPVPVRALAAFGIAPHAYLVQLRLARARQLLASGQPPARVAMTLGFADQSHMGRWFRRAYGLTPAHYRRRCSNLPDR